MKRVASRLRRWSVGKARFDSATRRAHLALLRSSRLFDASFYAITYPDLSTGSRDLAEHYLDYGGAEGRKPHALFDGGFYLAANPDVAGAGLNPLVHFLSRGAAEGRAPNPLFDPIWYADRHMDGVRSRAHALLHHLDHPRSDPSPHFQANWYAACCGAADDPLAHYFTVGRALGYVGNDSGVPESGSPAARLLASRLFDADFYLASYPDVAAAGLHPFSHYANIGHREGRTPNPLFDVGFYTSQMPDCGGVNPLLHYLDVGAHSGRDPNPLFETAWYLAEYPDCVASGLDPLSHFIADGGRSAKPCPRFDAPWYLDRHHDIRDAGVNPLAHYLLTGMGEGRPMHHVLRPDDLEGADPTRATIRLVKGEVPRSGRVVLMVTHTHDGRLKPHVGHLIASYRMAGLAVVLIVATDRRRICIPRDAMDACDAIYLRANAGFDFAAWAHAIRLSDGLLAVDLLVLANDSLIGPFGEDALPRLFRLVDGSAADVVGLTENDYYARHLQSFFLALKPRCLDSYAFGAFVRDVVVLSTKEQVIVQYEMTFSALMRAAGLDVAALFPGTRDGDRTLLDWEALMEDGLPFVKASLAAGEGREEMRHRLADLGFALDEVAPVRAGVRPVAWFDLHADAAPARPPRVAYLGPSNIANGLGMAARGYLKALWRTPWELNLHPLRRPLHVHARATPEWQGRSFDGDADVALVQVNGDGWDELLDAPQSGIEGRAGRRVGLLVWEASDVPPDWLPTLDRLDAIWVPTSFCADIFRSLTPVPVHVVPYVVENEAPERVAPGTLAALWAAFGLDGSKRHILYAFDGSSFLARKNPQALIRAFRASLLAADGWQLVLKTKHVFDLPLEGARLLDLVGSAGDVVVIDRAMPPREQAALFAACPIYASSHASEGFGLTIAEAMELGKVVVATDYGGSRDFLDASCGFPVRAEEVRLSEAVGPYGVGSAWGQVDESALAEALLRAARAVDDGTAAAIGSSARARIRERLSVAAVATAMTAAVDDLLGRPRP